MVRNLKYLFFIVLNVVLLTNSLFGKNDSLRNSNRYFLVSANFGISIYNKLIIDNNYKSSSKNKYFVNSKPMTYYNLSIEYNAKRVRLGATISNLSGEYVGDNFEYSIVNYGPHGYNSTQAKFNVYQKTKYQLTSIAFSFGGNLYRNKFHKVYIKGILNYIIYQKNTINNYYSNEQYGYDTTDYSLMKNKITNSKNINLPFFGASIGYEVKIYKNFIVDLSLSSFYLIYKGNHVDNNYVQDAIMKGYTDTREANNVYKQLFILPRIGVSYKFPL